MFPRATTRTNRTWEKEKKSVKYAEFQTPEVARNNRSVQKRSEPSQFPIRTYLFTQILRLFTCLNENHICIRTCCKGVLSGSSSSSQLTAKLQPNTAIAKYAKNLLAFTVLWIRIILSIMLNYSYFRIIMVAYNISLNNNLYFSSFPNFFR